jgi:hypothetical protein
MGSDHVRSALRGRELIQFGATFMIVGLDDNDLNKTQHIATGYHWVDDMEPEPGFAVEFILNGEKFLIPEINTRVMENPPTDRQTGIYNSGEPPPGPGEGTPV